ECAESARHKYKADAVFDEADFSRKEVMKVNGEISVTIAFLLVREFDVQAHRFAPSERGALIGRFHQPGPAARDHCQIMFRQSASQFDRGGIEGIGPRNSH